MWKLRLFSSRLFLFICPVCLILKLYTLQPVESALASPHKFRVQQPNQNWTQPLQMNGNERLNFMSDEDGYPVVMDSDCYYVYAKLDQSNGTLMPSTMRVDEVDPESEGFQKGMQVNDTVCSGTIMCDGQDNFTRWLDSEESDEGRQLRKSTGLVKNLVIMVRFADHQGRRLPTTREVDILYNSRGGDATIAKSGSIRDVYLSNSYGQLDLQSKAYGWVTLPKTEAYYAGGVSGLGEVYKEAVRDALVLLQAQYQVDFDSFDANNDGFVDTISLFHSGYAAEWGSTDSSGNSMWQRIWSHRWAIPTWTSRSGVKASTYCTVPALWGTGGSEIGRIGVIAHELGHTFALPDLYGGNGGLGIGSYGMMGNSWGFAGSQYYPPMFSAWSKIQLGWLVPTTISSSGQYSLGPSATRRETYKIHLGPQEYLLIENRQPLEYDVDMKQGGLCIWHIDEKADDRNAGFPGEQGWPRNGKHYRVALLQADGNYQLEKGENRGDEYDVFHSGGKNSLGPSRSAGFGPYPNTDAYQGGQVHSSGISIYNIRQSGDRMHFTVEIPGTSTPPPTSPPVPPPTQPPPDRKPREVRTRFVGGNGAAGSMFDVWPRDNIILFGMGIHTSAIETATVEVWTKSGSFQGFETNSRAWTRILSTTMEGLGRGKPTFIELDPLRLPAMQTRAFYVTATSGRGLRYTNGRGVGRVYASSSEIDILEGVGKRYPFGSTFRNRQWNGVLQYYVVSDPMMEQETDPPTISPTPVPTPPPTPAPVQSNSYYSVETTFVGGTEQAGNMFDVLALEDIVVTNFDIHCSVEGPVTVEIYTKSESHVDFERDCSKWTLAARVTTLGQGQGKHTPLPVGSFDPVPIGQFRIRAFYITILTSNGRGMRYTRGRGRGTVIAADDSIEVLEGTGTAYACGRFFKNRVWNGVVYYDRRDPTQTLPPISTTLSLTTTYAGGKQENGNMFVIKALKDLSIVEMSIHTEQAGEAQLEIYTKPGTYDGFELNPLAWMVIANRTISTHGSGEVTPVPSDSFAPIFIHEGETKAFYVTLTSEDMNMRYTDGEDWDSIALSNDDLEVSKGFGVDYPFEKVYQDRIWNGVLKYVLEQEE